MKSKLLAVILFFLPFFGFSSGTHTPALPHGTELCREIQNTLAEKKFSTQTAPVVISTYNDVPYNITVKLKSSNKGKVSNVRNNLIFIVSQESFYASSDFFLNLLELLSAEKFDYDITFLFSFSSKDNIPGFYTISGETAFLNTLEDKQECSAVILNPGAENTSIIPGSSGNVAPTWILKNVFYSANKTRIINSFQACYLSFLYKANLYAEPVLNDFLFSGIPAVKINLSQSIDKNLIKDFILDFCINYNLESTAFNDTHSAMITLFGHHIWFTEEIITKLILIIIFLTFSMLILYGFLNKNLHLKAWNRIRKIWFYPIAIFFISVGVVHVYKKLSQWLNTITGSLSTYLSICFILPLIFAILTLLFSTVLKFRPHFKKRTIDFLTLITSTINLVIFTLADISLFPLLALEFILAWISTVFSKNFIHILIMILFEIPYLPFLIQLFSYADNTLLENTIKTNTLLSISLLLLMLPQYLNCFRVFTGMNFYWFKIQKQGIKKEKNNMILYVIFLAVFEVILFFLLPPSFKDMPDNQESTISNTFPEDYLSVSVSDKKVFNDKIRTLNITSKRNLEFCDIRIKTTDSTPILFSEDDFIMHNSTEAVFTLPYQPPKNLIFNYGTSEVNDSVIIVTAIYKENGLYYREEKKIRTSIN